ncbi:MAG: hypothetical protein HFJ36_05385 [Clostridia bacterium]|nr:hypothetical protein [Clostridia bacterium]
MGSIIKTNGITLIALVITIIVLLILAGVAITTLTGENGILNKADTAQVETRAATVEELVRLWKTEQTADNMIGENKTQTLGQLLDKLEEDNLITQEERTIIEDDGEITIGNKTIIFEKLNAIDKVGNKVNENINDDGSINYEKLKEDLESIKNIQGVPENLGEDSFPLIVEINGELVQINQNGTVRTSNKC